MRTVRMFFRRYIEQEWSIDWQGLSTTFSTKEYAMSYVPSTLVHLLVEDSSLESQYL